MYQPRSVITTVDEIRALLGPVFGWILQRVSGGSTQLELGDFQTTFTPMLYGVGIAIVLILILRETGSAVRRESKT